MEFPQEKEKCETGARQSGYLVSLEISFDSQGKISHSSDSLSDHLVGEAGAEKMRGQGRQDPALTRTDMLCIPLVL